LVSNIGLDKIMVVKVDVRVVKIRVDENADLG
jgi:hypothetical protein